MKGSLISLLIVVASVACYPLLQFNGQRQSRVSTAESFMLFADNARLPDIVIAASADAVEIAVARDLARMLAAMSGQPEPAILKESWRNRHSGIHVGHTRQALTSGWDNLHPFDRIVHEVTARGILLYGQDSKATELAVYAWLRSQLGVRWFMPGADGEFIPTPDTVLLQVHRHEFTPSYISRRTDFNGRHREAANLWARRNGMREFFSYNHNLYRIFDYARFQQEPELFPLINGQRVPPNRSRPGDSAQPDFSNPRVAALTAEAALNYFRKNPDSLSFSIAPNDSHTFGEYPEDFPYFDPNRFFRGLLDYSDAVFAFSNAVAEKVIPEFPDRFIGTLSYADYENMPSFPVHPRIVPFLTADRSQWYDPDFVEDDKALVRAWVANGPEIVGFWDYFFGSMYMIPRLAHGPLVDSIRFMHEAGVQAYYSQMGPVWGFDAWKAYAMLNLLWDVDLDVEAEWQLFLTSLFGPSAPHMQAFFEQNEAIWMAQRRPALWLKHYANNHQAVLFSEQAMGELRAHLQAAKAMELNPRQRAAVQLSSDAFAVTEAFVSFMRHQWAVDDLTLRSRSEFEQALTAIRQQLALRQTFDQLSRATSQSGELGLNAALANQSWVFNSSSLPKLTYRAARWIQQKGRPDDLPVLVDALSGWDRVAPLVQLAASWASSPAGVEIMLDGGFESGVVQPHWFQRIVPWEGSFIEVTDTHARSGQHALAIHQAGYHTLEQGFAVSPGVQLTTSIHLKGTISESSFALLDLTWFDENWQRLSGTLHSRLPPHAGEDWYELVAAGVAPDNARFARARLFIISMLAGDVLYADDFSVRFYQP